MKNVLACLLCLFVCVKVFGLDAKINGIHYTLNTEKKTAHVSDGENISSETTGDYIGDVVIPAMDKLVSLSLIPPTIYSSTFYKTDEMVPHYVPAECVGIYKESEYWKDFDIYPITENANTKSDI